MDMVPTNTKKKVSNHISDDIAFSILSKLPLKSLKRFSCAQQSWSLLLQNPYFITIFRKCFLSANHSLYDDTSVLIKVEMRSVNHSLYLLSGDCFENKFKLEMPLLSREEDFKYWYLPTCANGILCLFDSSHKKGMLWNPATQKRINFNPSPFEFLSFDKASFYIHGFGYDHIRDDYKVIRCVEVFRYNPGDEADLAIPTGSGIIWEVYSLRSNSWRRLSRWKFDDKDGPASLGYSNIYLNGVCHWFGKLGHFSMNMVKCLVSFNLSSEVFVTTPLLLDMHDSDYFYLNESCFMVLNGSIAMISKKSKTASFHISILGELGVKESWVELFIIGPLPFISCPIGAGKKGEIFFRTTEDVLVCFDLNTQTFQEIGLKDVVPSKATIYKKNPLPFPIGGVNKYLLFLSQLRGLWV